MPYQAFVNVYPKLRTILAEMLLRYIDVRIFSKLKFRVSPDVKPG